MLNQYSFSLCLNKIVALILFVLSITPNFLFASGGREIGRKFTPASRAIFNLLNNRRLGLRNDTLARGVERPKGEYRRDRKKRIPVYPAYAQSLEKFTRRPQIAKVIVEVLEEENRYSSNLYAPFLEEYKKIFDLIVVGAGPHGEIFRHELVNQMCENNQNLRVLSIEESGGFAQTFKTLGDNVALNSPSRPQSKDSLELPGKGDLNRLPGLPVQPKDLSGFRYPPVGAIPQALTLSASTVNHIIPVLMESKVTGITPFEDNFIDVEIERKDGTTLKLTTRVLVTATGLGKPKTIKSIEEGLRPDLEEIQQQTSEGKAFKPCVLNYSEFYTLLKTCPGFFSNFQDSFVAVVGDGNSAKTVIENIYGLAPNTSVSPDPGNNANEFQPEKLWWIGPNVPQDCTELTEKDPVRYSGLGTLLGEKRPVIPIQKKALSYSLDSEGHIQIKLDNNKSLRRVKLVIDATGFDADVGIELSPEVYSEKRQRRNASLSKVTSANNEYKSKYITNPQTAGNVYPEGSAEIVARSLYDDTAVFAVGAGATESSLEQQGQTFDGELVSEDLLAGRPENRVSIFALAPKTKAAAKDFYELAMFYSAKGTELLSDDLRRHLKQKTGNEPPPDLIESEGSSYELARTIDTFADFALLALLSIPLATAEDNLMFVNESVLKLSIQRTKDFRESFSYSFTSDDSTKDLRHILNTASFLEENIPLTTALSLLLPNLTEKVVVILPIGRGGSIDFTKAQLRYD